MRIATGQEMRLLEEQLLRTSGISSLLLMENAGRGAADILSEEYGPLQGKRVHILAGRGNNGGDGLVVARHLLLKSARPKVYLVGDSSAATPEHRANLEILRKLGADLVAVKENRLDKLRFSLGLADVIVDAIFGTGLRGALPQELAALVELVNELKPPVVSIDVPSGVDSSTGRAAGAAVRADLTIGLGLIKVGCLLYPGRDYAGRIKLAHLGIPLGGETEQARFLLDASILELLPKRAAWGHKGTFGQALVVGGSEQYAGAPALCGQAYLRGGGGLAVLAVPRGIYKRFPPDELIVVPCEQTEAGGFSQGALPKLFELAQGKDVLIIGPGLGDAPEGRLVVQKLLSGWQGPCVIDADALQALSPEFLESIPPASRRRWVLTPHPGEMGRLISGTAQNVNDDRLNIAEQFAKKWGLIVVLKGAPTIISDGEKTYLNGSGSHGLATAGTGDVLAGLVGALLAQDLSPLKAAAAAVFAHGSAGDLAGDSGQRGLTAGDCLKLLPQVLK